MEFHKNSFDLLRILAALQVVGTHIADHLTGYGPVMQIVATLPGVPIFFVISGVLVSASYERAPNLRAYVTARFLRIYPGLWACLIVSILVAATLGGVSFITVEAGPWLLAQTTIAQFVNPKFLRWYGTGVLNGALWTIPVELQFYAVLPALMSLRTPMLLLILVASAAGNVALSSVEQTLPVKLAGITVLQYLHMFLVGVLLQRHLHIIQRFLAGHAVAWLCIFFLVTISLHQMGFMVTGNNINPLSAIILGFLVVSIAYTYPISLRYDLSYGVYIYHMVAINALVHLGWRGTVAASVTVISSLIFAFLSWVAIERPALRLKSRQHSHRTPSISDDFTTRIRS